MQEARNKHRQREMPCVIVILDATDARLHTAAVNLLSKRHDIPYECEYVTSDK